MLHRENVCIEIGNPLLALLRDSKVAQGISDIRSERELLVLCYGVLKTGKPFDAAIAMGC